MDEFIPKIHSYPRSGTHLLAETLGRNFYSHLDLSTPQSGGGHWAKRRRIGRRAYGQMFRPGPHKLGYELEKNRVHFYIYRDGRDVAVSLWNAKDMIGPKYDKMPFSEFLRAKLDWLWLPSNKSDPTMSVVEQWKAHLDSWENIKKVFFVRYADLVEDPVGTIEDIAEFLGRQPEHICPVTEKVGVWPGPGKVGGWHEIFTDDDLDYFYSIVAPTILEVRHG